MPFGKGGGFVSIFWCRNKSMRCESCDPTHKTQMKANMCIEMPFNLISTLLSLPLKARFPGNPSKTQNTFDNMSTRSVFSTL